jgi:hypothetical protein
MSARHFSLRLALLGRWNLSANRCLRPYVIEIEAIRPQRTEFSWSKGA